MVVDVSRRENKHTQWRAWRVTKYNVGWICVMRIHSSRARLCSLYYWHAVIDDSILFTQSWWGNNSSCFTTSRYVKSFSTLGFLPTHGRTLKKSSNSGIQLFYSVWGEWEWLTQANNYWWWKLDQFLRGRNKTSKPRLEKKKRKKRQENLRVSDPPDRWC